MDTLTTDDHRTTASHVDYGVLDSVSNAKFYNPHAILGGHLNDGEGEGHVTVRTLRPLAKHVTIVTQHGEYDAQHEFNGIFTVVIPAQRNGAQWSVPDYRIRTTYADGTTLVEDDPYRYLPTVGDVDVYLFGEGRHERLWEVLGAHIMHFDDPMGSANGEPGKTVDGVSFAVWAPNAHAVRVVGDFNYWDGRRFAMREIGSSGIWELFIPGLEAGALYKYEILNSNGEWKMKADPMERGHQIPPATASKVVDSHHTWHDDSWMTRRAQTDPHSGPISIYELHAGSWREGLNYRELADQLVEYVKDLGFTHVEFMPLTQHPFTGSWGYQVTGYYAPDSRHGSYDDLKYLIDTLHQAGIGVVMDWVPAHFPKDDFALGRFDGTPLYEDPDPQRGEHPDWGTYVFNFGRNEVRNFLVANALYWLSEFHIDALRVDAVSSMLYLDYSRKDGEWHPNIYGGRENLEAISFLQEATATAYRDNPGIMMIAEESTSWQGVTAPTDAGGLGFGLKWNMGWMHDTLEYMQESPINRKYHHDEITFSMVYAYSEHYVLPISHDEVVHGKGSLMERMPGDDWQRFAGVRALFAYQWAHPGKKLTFMGNELAQFEEWNNNHSIDWDCLNWEDHRGVQRLVADLNALYKRMPALWSQDFDPAGFQWLTSDDSDHNVLSFARFGNNGEAVVVVVNFSGNAWSDYQVALPQGGSWKEVLTTDDSRYGGSNIHNDSFVADEEPYHSREWSVKLTIPALGALFLVPED
ncbi:1,4-alpha-glucan branching protein GlgB [Bifidobacterium crudilactis]|jgi:1,4-alpha-glucan branching enzyme|uniref:1,4-alpha-glucan branching enzyme GlgB n=1 Tax=Bifidobacterium crudilactis TaxID=327277 RepID=A0A971D0D2_9BIFI|nr:1,4-alpha-glucan branching protein GlgB [Bifidobacterium crudilactis]MCI1867730.1 1,4-alpha-glucan branching protein GlgB [Bifidobacterium crudilactis]NLT80283.1 1,4-alpha-glucan branching protein GlgB [Bifidobacterium crudilactis]